MSPSEHLQAAKEAVAKEFGFETWDAMEKSYSMIGQSIMNRVCTVALTNQAEELREEKSDSWIDVNDRLPELGDEYNVVWELKDGGKPVSTTVQWDAIRNIWFDETYPDGVPNILFWQPLPRPKHI